MASYSRGWKGSQPGPNPFFKKFERKTSGHSSGGGKDGKRIIAKIIELARNFFSYAWAALAWFSRWLFQRRSFWKRAFLVVAALGIIGFVFLGALLAYYSFNLPDPRFLMERDPVESTKIYDRNGKLLYEVHGEVKRTLVELDQIPQFVKDATIAIEDKDFYSHGGVDFTGIIRSVFVNLRSGSLSQGGSTITQQFVRNAVLTREKTFTRKIKEIAMSLQLERKYSKDEILKLYLNEIPYGSNAYGIYAASQTFFAKEPKDLTLTEAAYLAAMPQAPTFYSPYGLHRKDLDDRADTVLQLMFDQGYITKDQRNLAQNEKVEFKKIGNSILAPHFVMYIQDILAKNYGEVSLQEGGLKVTTTLDYDLQVKAEEAVQTTVAENEKKYNVTNGGLVAINPQNGQILAMVGSRDYFNEEHDGAVNVTLQPLQPGSSFKPYVYAAAFKEGMSPATMIMDVETNFGEFGGEQYIPHNYDEKTRGPVSIRTALQGSLNIPAVKVLMLTGIEDSIRTAESMGITTLKDRSRFGPSIVLGGAEVKLLEHTAAYGVFATNGVKHETVPILKVEDRSGKVLEEWQESRGREVLNPQIAYQITNVLSDNDARAYIFGRNSKLTLPGRPVATKTGTTQKYKDAWTIGYTPSLVAGVWMGNNDATPMTGGASGSLTAAAVWNEFMQKALEGKPVEQFARPEGLVDMDVDSVSGKLPTSLTPSTKKEIFSSFNIPKQDDDLHVLATYNGETKVYAVFHSEQPDNPAWENPVRAWALANGYVYPDEQPGEEQTDLNLKISVTNPVTTLPWQVSVQAETDKDVKEIQIFLDNQFLQSSLDSKSLEYTGTAAHVDGHHELVIQGRTGDNKTNRRIIDLTFALGKKLLILSPQDNQELVFPTNIALEGSALVEISEVKFWRKSAGGQETAISGNISRQKTGQVYLYTLNWSEADKPAKGSYSIYGQIGADTSNSVTVKIP